MFQLYVEKIVLNTYPNALRTVKQDYITGHLPKGLVLSKLTVVLEGCQGQKTALISGGECWSAGLSSYLVFQIKQRQLNILMISTKLSRRRHIREHSVLPLLISQDELLLVLTNHLFSRILVEGRKICHQCPPFLLIYK